MSIDGWIDRLADSGIGNISAIVDLKQEIHVIIQSKHSCRLDFFLRI